MRKSTLEKCVWQVTHVVNTDGDVPAVGLDLVRPVVSVGVEGIAAVGILAAVSAGVEAIYGIQLG